MLTDTTSLYTKHVSGNYERLAIIIFPRINWPNLMKIFIHHHW